MSAHQSKFQILPRASKIINNETHLTNDIYENNQVHLLKTRHTWLIWTNIAYLCLLEIWQQEGSKILNIREGNKWIVKTRDACRDFQIFLALFLTKAQIIFCIY